MPAYIARPRQAETLKELVPDFRLMEALAGGYLKTHRRRRLHRHVLNATAMLDSGLHKSEQGFIRRPAEIQRRSRSTSIVTPRRRSRASC